MAWPQDTEQVYGTVPTSAIPNELFLEIFNHFLDQAPDDDAMTMHGVHLCTCADNGDTSYLRHRKP